MKFHRNQLTCSLIAAFMGITVSATSHAEELVGLSYQIDSAPKASAALPTSPDTLITTGDLLNDDLNKDLWARIRNGYAIPDLNNQYVTSQLTWYSTRTDYIKRTVERGSRYLYHVVEELEKRGMPTELALLPFIESAFKAFICVIISL